MASGSFDFRVLAPGRLRSSDLIAGPTGTGAWGLAAAEFFASGETEIQVLSASYIDWATRTNATLLAPHTIPNGAVILLLHEAFATGTWPGVVPAVTAPAGFTLYDPSAEGAAVWFQDGGGGAGTRIWYKTADNESGSYTLTHGSMDCEAYIVVLAGVKSTGSPFGTAGVRNSSTSTSTATGLGITTSASKSWLLMVEMDNSGSGGLVPPPNMTDRRDAGIVVSTELRTTAGATGDRVMTAGSSVWATRMFELLLAAGSSNATAAGAASGVGIAAAIGRSTARDDAAASGVGTAVAVGRSTARSTGTAAGVGTAPATGRGVIKGSGAGSGTGTATATGRSTARSPGAATGIGAAFGIGRSAARSIGAAAGAGAAAGVGQSTARSAGAASGAGSASAVGSTGGGSAGSASASGTATATGRSTARSSALGAGIGAALGIGRSRARSDAAASGLGAGLGIGRSTARGVGNATATGIPSGAGKVTSRAAGSASGTGMAAAVSTAGGGGVTDDWSSRMGGSERLSSLAL